MSKVLAIFFILVCRLMANAQFFLDLEGDYIASVPYNRVKVPSDVGTHFDLSNDLMLKSSFTFRIRANYIFKERHLTSILFAPLFMRSTGMVDQSIGYNGETFRINDPLEAIYKVNSYRLTYRYLLVRNQDLIIGAGLTANATDVSMTLRSGNQASAFRDLALLPYVNFYALWSPIDNWMILLEGDVFVTGKRREEDIFGGIGYRFSDMFVLKGGYRLLEGEGNQEKYYNYKWINYLAFGVLISF